MGFPIRWYNKVLLTLMTPPPKPEFFSKAEIEVSLRKKVLFITFTVELSLTAIPTLLPTIT